MKWKKNAAYYSEATSSTVLMYRQSSSIKSSSVGLVGGGRSNDCEMNPTSDDSFDALMFLGGPSKMTQSLGSIF